MRTAILIPGYLRYYKECYDNFNEFIVKPFQKYGEVDLFVHTWRNVPEEYFGVVQFRQEHGGFVINHPEIDIEDFISLYKPKKIVVEDFLEVKENLKLRNFVNLDEIISELYSPKLWHDGILHTTSQYFKIYETNKLKSIFEKENNFKYDFVVKYRSDALSPKPIPVEQLIKDKLYLVDFGHDSKMVADSFWIGSSELIDYICSIYKEFPDIYNRAKELKHGFAVEKMLYYYLGDKWPQIERLCEFGLLGEKMKFYGRP